ncbi:slipin family protein [bacterium]|nr:slipin family protein [bacterium]MCG2676211.1 slipin family protein [bacterium]MCG2677994.1 slipin family protein [bacterium]
MTVGITIAVVVFIILAQAIKVFKEYERGVIFRLGRLVGAKGPGLFFIIPVMDKVAKVDLRTETFDVKPQEIITKDNVPVKVNAVVYFRVLDPNKAVVEVKDYRVATLQIAQTTLRGVLGQVELDELLSERDKINQKLQQIIDSQTDPWGIKVSIVEVKEVELPDTMKRAMAGQAEAERDRRAKIVNAQGEYQAAEKLSQAAEIIGKHPVAIQLRYLQTLSEVASENNSTTLFPIPIDLFTPFIKKMMETKKEKE